MKRKQLEMSGLSAVLLIRKKNLANGHPFMINLSSLPENQCYLEYPDGNIQLVSLNRTKRDFEVIRPLTKAEQKAVREKLQLH